MPAGQRQKRQSEKGGGLPGPGSKRSKLDTPHSERIVEAEGPDGGSTAAGDTPPIPRKKRSADSQGVVPPGKRQKKEQQAGGKGSKEPSKDSSATPSKEKNGYFRNRDDYDVDTPENRKKLNASRQGFGRDEIQHYRTSRAVKITWLIHYHDEELPMNVIFFYSSKPHLAGPFSVFSNFAITPFRYPRLHPTHTFSCVEQAYQYAKMHLQYTIAGDFELPPDILRQANGERMTVGMIVRAILAEDSPSAITTLGRATGYRLKTDLSWRNKWWPAWESVLPNLLTEMVFCKFYQNEEPKKLLLATGDFTLVEASQNDPRCGIGKHASEAVRAIAKNNNKLTGANYLGSALERTRTRLREVHPTAPTTYAFWPFFRWEKAINDKRERKAIFGEESYQEAMKETQKAWDEYYADGGTEFATDSQIEQYPGVSGEARFIELRKQTAQQLPFDLSRPLIDKHVSSQLEAGVKIEDLQLPNAGTTYSQPPIVVRKELEQEWEALQAALNQLEEQHQQSPNSALADEIAKTKNKMFNVAVEAKNDVIAQVAEFKTREAGKNCNKEGKSPRIGTREEAGDSEKSGRVEKDTGAAAEDVEMGVDDGAGVTGVDVEMGEGNVVEGAGKDEEIQVEAAAGGVGEDVEMKDVNGDEYTEKTNIQEKKTKRAKRIEGTRIAFEGSLTAAPSSAALRESLLREEDEADGTKPAKERVTAAGSSAILRPSESHDTSFGQASASAKKKPYVGISSEDDEEKQNSLTQSEMEGIESGNEDVQGNCPTITTSGSGAAADVKATYHKMNMPSTLPLHNDRTLGETALRTSPINWAQHWWRIFG
ncbi:hypothetical protein KC336_g18317 [Hortaea werneckii]|nr:hypothetical protein KC336_g18317 [Hortaea werneckii]